MHDPIRTNYLLNEILLKLVVLQGQQAQPALKIEEKKEKRWLLTEDVKDILQISTTTLWRRVQSGILMPSKMGGINYYNYADIERFLKTHQVTSTRIRQKGKIGFRN